MNAGARRGAPVCAISIDVDPLPCYYRIHALGEPPREVRDVVARRALPRLGELLAARGIKATFFVVAQDVAPGGGDAARAARELYQDLARAGHELGNHSYSHPYDLARFGRDAARDEIERAHELIGALGAGPVRGFRAPGYDLSPAMVGELEALGYAYDSSLFPAPGYYAAKAAVMAALAVTGRPSGAVLTNPRALAAPATPYRPSAAAPWRRGAARLVELPVAVTPIARVPVIGTTLLVAPAWLRRAMMAAMRLRGFFNLELHGIDLCDAAEDGIPAELVARQPDLRVPLARKRAALEDVLDRALEEFRVARLCDLADEWASDL